jgi:hypothetical protein
MGLAGKIFGGKKTGPTEGYVDLEKYVETTTPETPTKSTSDTPPKTSYAKMHVAVGEIQRYEDLKSFSDYVYGGNILILDFSPIAEEEVILKRITNDLRKMIADIDGDIAGIGNNMMIVSPSKVKIDRRKLRGKYA